MVVVVVVVVELEWSWSGVEWSGVFGYVLIYLGS